MPAKATSVVCLLACLLPSGLSAAPVPDGESTAPLARDLGLQLRRNLSWVLASEFAYGRTDERTADGRLRLVSSATTGPHQLRLGLSLAYGDRGSLYDQEGYRLGLGSAATKPQRRRRLVDIDRLMWTVGWGDVDFTLGRWATEEGSYPADRLAPYDLNEPTRPRVQSRWALTAEIYLGDHAYKAAFYPFFIPSKRPAEASAWSQSRTGGAGDFYFLGAEPGLDEARPSGPAQSLLSVGYRGRRRGWDWGWGLDWGPDQYPVLTAGRDGAATRRYLRKTYLSADTESPSAPLAFYGRGLAQIGGGDDRFLALGLGLKVRRRALVFKAVYRREWIVQRAGGANLLASSRQARWGRDDLGLQASWESGSLAVKAGLHRLLGAGSYRSDAEVGWRRDGLYWCLVAEAFSGSKSQYGRWRRNDRLLLMAAYRR